MPGYNPYVSSSSPEKQPITMGYSSSASSAPYNDPPPSYDPHGTSQGWGPRGAFPVSGPGLARSSPGHQQYSPPPGPPPDFQRHPSSASNIANYGPYSASSGYPPTGMTSSISPDQRFPALLTPAPPSFQRAPSRNMPYGAFEPLEVPAVGRGLEGGFVATLPPSTTQPHPFGTHDIKESDWLRFLDDIKRAGALAARDRAPAQSAPQLGRSGGLLSGLLAQGIQSMQGSSRGGSQGLAPVIEVLQYWNQYFFNQRSVEVDLTGPVNEQDSSYTPQSSFLPDLDPCPRRRGRRAGGRSGGGPLSTGLRELKTELMSKAAAGSGGGQRGGPTNQRWCIVVRYKGLSAW